MAVGYEIDNERMKLMLSQMKGQDKHLPWLLLGRSLLQSQAVAVVVVRCFLLIGSELSNHIVVHIFSCSLSLLFGITFRYFPGIL
jgi:hypothetical protein